LSRHERLLINAFSLIMSCAHNSITMIRTTKSGHTLIIWGPTKSTHIPFMHYYATRKLQTRGQQISFQVSTLFLTSNYVGQIVQTVDNLLFWGLSIVF